MEFYVQKHISTKLLVRHLLKREKSVKRLKEKASDHHYFAHFFFFYFLQVIRNFYLSLLLRSITEICLCFLEYIQSIDFSRHFQTEDTCLSSDPRYVRMFPLFISFFFKILISVFRVMFLVPLICYLVFSFYFLKFFTDFIFKIFYWFYFVYHIFNFQEHLLISNDYFP